jgi:hypothetical protein
MVRPKYHKIIYLFLALCALYAVSFCYWIIRDYPASAADEIKFGLSWFFYPHLILLFLLSNLKHISLDSIINYILGYACVFALSFAVSFLTGNAMQYYRGLAFSFSGLIISGNDFALMMLMANCMACYMYFRTGNGRYAVINIIITAMTMLIGSTAGVFGSAFIMICFTMNRCFVKNFNRLTRQWQRIYSGFLFVIGIPILVFVIRFIVTFSEFSKNKFSFKLLASGHARNWLKEAAVKNLQTYSITDWIFGTGADNMERRIGRLTGTGIHNIEIDHYDEISAYGLLFGGICWFLPLLFTICLVRNYIKHRSEFYFWSALAMTLFVVHGFFAGHASISILALQAAAILFFAFVKRQGTGERRV